MKKCVISKFYFILFFFFCVEVNLSFETILKCLVQAYGVCWDKKNVQFPRQPWPAFRMCAFTGPMFSENQAHAQQVDHPEKSIAHGGIIDELQTSCLSAGNVGWIREAWYHAGFSKEDLTPRGTKMPEHMINIENKY